MELTSITRPTWAGPSKSPPTTGDGDSREGARDDEREASRKNWRTQDWLLAAPAGASWQDVAEASQDHESPHDVPGWGEEAEGSE